MFSREARKFFRVYKDFLRKTVPDLTPPPCFSEKSAEGGGEVSCISPDHKKTIPTLFFFLLKILNLPSHPILFVGFVFRRKKTSIFFPQVIKRRLLPRTWGSVSFTGHIFCFDYPSIRPSVHHPSLFCDFWSIAANHCVLGNCNLNVSWNHLWMTFLEYCRESLCIGKSQLTFLEYCRKSLCIGKSQFKIRLMGILKL